MIFAVFNAGEAIDVTLPELPKGMIWEAILDTTEPTAGRNCVTAQIIKAPANCVLAFARTSVGKEAT